MSGTDPGRPAEAAPPLQPAEATSPLQPAGAATPLQRAAIVIRDLQARLTAAEAAGHEPIAVIGIGCRFPGADGPEAFRRLLMGGVDATGPVPAERWPTERWTGEGPGRIASPRGGFLSGSPADFDAGFFRIAPREAVSIDPQQRLLLEVAWEALEDAGQAGPALAGSKTGVFVGISLFDWGWRLMGRRRAEAIDAYAASGVMHSVASGRIAFAFDLAGPAVSVDTACSSSLVAVHLAARAIRAGDCDMALAGGASLMLEPELGVAFSQSRMLAPDGRCKTFSAAADGYGRAEGAGIVVLKRLSAAERDGDRILAVLRGSAVNQDGATSGLTVPNGPAQQAVIRAALADARVSPADVAYVEAHGTGTPLGDPIEIGALGAVFAGSRPADDPLLVGSVKANIGHAEGAAGIAGFIKAVLTLEAGTVPPHLHGSPPNPHVDWAEGRIAVPAAPVPLVPHDGRRIVGVSAFGFSGTNAHAVLEAPPPRATRPADLPRPGLLTLSAATPKALSDLAASTAEALAASDPAAWSSICRTLGAGRGRFAERLALVAEGPAEAARALREGSEAVRRRRIGAEPGGLAFVYTGQGAFSAAGANASGLDRLGPAFRDRFEAASRWLAAHLGAGLDALLADPARLARRTDLAQPAQFALQVALTAAYREAAILPDRVLGHSLGEFAAAEATGVLDLETGLRLTAARGRLMQALADDTRAPRTGMLALPLDAGAVARLIAGGPDLVVAADNAPRATVVAGPLAALDRLSARLRAENIAAEPLDVPIGFHSPALAGMAEAFRAEVAAARLGPAGPGLISAMTGREAGAETADPDFWVSQILRPVRFRAGLERLAAAGVTDIVEIGPRARLGGAVRATFAAAAPDRPVTFAAALVPGRDARTTLLESLGGLALAGREIDFAVLEPEARAVRLPTYPWQRERYWVEAEPAAAGPPPADPLDPVPVATPLPQAIHTLRLDPGRPAWLGEHRVGGRIVVPLAVVAEILRRSASGRAERDIAELDLTAPIAVPDGGVEIQLVADPVAAGRRSVTIHARPAGDAGAAFTLHGRAVLARLDPSSPADDRGTGASPTEPAPSVPLHGSAASPDSLWRRAEAAGIELGPAFRHLAGLSVTDAVASARLAAAEPRSPALALDAALQVALALIPDDGATWVPIRLAGCHWPDALSDDLSVEARRLGDGERPTFRLMLRDAAGRAVGTVEAATFARLPTAGANLLHDLVWIEAPLPAGARPLAAIEPEIRTAMAAIFAEPSVETYAAALPALEAAIPGRIAAALVDLGWNAVPPGRHATAALADRLGIAPTRRRLFAHLLARLAGWGVIEGEAATGWWVAPLSAPEPKPLPAAPAVAIETALTERCTAALAGVLVGTIDPLDLLFPGRRLDDALSLYADSPWSVAMGRTLAAAVAAILAGRSRASGPKVLEVGGGTGATTARLLPLLPEGARYRFTDLSPLFLRRAEERFGDLPVFSTALLDLEDADAAPELSGFDLIVAANVVHATADIAASLKSLARRLAPGGSLVLQEGTGALAWGDVTFGLTDGWWRFRDADLRPDHPMPPPARWREALARAGLDEVAVFDAAETPAGKNFRQAVLVARRSPARGRIAVLGSGQATKALADRLARDGRAIVSLDDTTVDGFAAGLVDAILVAGEAPAPVDDPAAAGIALAARTLARLAALAAAADRLGRLPPVWIVTTGAAALEIDGGTAALAASGLVGPVRAISAERPDLRVGLLDLPALSGGLLDLPTLGAGLLDLRAAGTGFAPADLDRAVEDVAAWSGERMVAIRGGRRHVARLMSAAPALPAAAPFRLETAVRGLPSSLRPQAFEPAAPGPGEIEIEVLAAGLNFRDVLLALDLYPGGGALGHEAAGIVRRVGPGVTSFQPGDRVAGLGAGTLASHAILRADHALPLAPGQDIAEASAQLVAWVTALHALVDLAAVRPGERVLVHAAASGTGLAALRLAHRLGAEVHATASPGKQAILRAEGAAAIQNSRDTAFADAILAATGGRGVDVVIDALTGPGMIEASLKAAAPGARFVELGRIGILSQAQMAARRPDIAYSVVDLAQDARERPDRLARLVREAGRMLAAGEVAPLPVARVPFERAGAALRLMEEGRQTGRIALVRPPAPATDAAAKTWLITGAFGGVGLALAAHLAETGRAGALLLVGRRPPDAAANAALARIAGLVRIETCVADVTDRAAMAAAIDLCGNTLPPLGSVVHAAGSLDDAPLAALTADRIETVMAPKLAGGWILHDLTRDRALDSFVLFGSAVGVLGNAGQANHAAASAALDGLAAWRRARGLPALVVDWGVWGETGAAIRTGRAEDLARLGLVPMPTAAALAAFDRVLGEDRGRVVVAGLDLPRLAERRPGDPLFAPPAASAAGPKPEAAAPAGDWRSLEGAARAAAVRGAIDRAVAAVLGLRAEAIDPAARFFEIGMDSLTAVELRHRLARDLALDLPATLVFDHPTPAAVAAFVLADDGAPADTPPVRAPAPVPGDVDASAGGLDLSDDDLLALADRRLDDIEEFLA